MKTLEKKLRVGILGATGMVGQRFVTLLENHPWFTVTVLSASERSRGKSYKEALEGRWNLPRPIPQGIQEMAVLEVEKDMDRIVEQVDFVFSALAMEKRKIMELENRYAEKDIPVVSCNSAHRWTEDVPMLIPEVNPHHLDLIEIQRKSRGWKKGCIAVKPNCSIQSFLPVLEPLRVFGLERVIVSTYQAISGAGKTFATWPEMKDNVIPYISGEEEKTEKEPLKIWAELKEGKLVLPEKPVISSTCIRIPVSDGHMASVSVKFTKKPSRNEIIEAIQNFENPLDRLNLPSAPKKFLTYFENEDRPQTALDRDLENGMGIAMGRLREDPVLDWKFVALSHNTLRGAAGGALLIAELMVAKGYIEARK